MSFRIDIYSAWPIVIPDASPTKDGLMSAADKAKLNSLSSGGIFLKHCVKFTPKSAGT